MRELTEFLGAHIVVVMGLTVHGLQQMVQIFVINTKLPFMTNMNHPRERSGLGLN